MNITDQKSVLREFSEILSTVTTSEQMGLVSEIALNKLSRMDLSETNGILVDSVCSCLLSLAITFQPMSTSTLDLIEFLFEKGIMPTVFREKCLTLHSNFLDKRFAINRVEESKEEMEFDRLEGTFRKSLGLILTGEQDPARFINRTYGSAFLKLNGDFIWADASTTKFLELKGKAYNNNLFNLMVPFSSNLLYKKYGRELFLKACDEKSLVFSYVIYSTTAVNKFVKHLKKNGITCMSELKDDPSANALYYKYLKALSSRATLIYLQYDDDEKIVGCKEVKDGEDKKEKESEKHLSILLETRISKTIPEFDYLRMLNDPVIEKFEESVKKRISK